MDLPLKLIVGAMDQPACGLILELLRRANASWQIDTVSDLHKLNELLLEANHDCAIVSDQIDPSILELASARLPVIYIGPATNLTASLTQKGFLQQFPINSISSDTFSHAVGTTLRIHQAETRAIVAQQRLSVLVESSEVFSTSLDYQATLHSLARLVVNHLADICVIDMIEGENTTLRRSAILHRDPELQPLAQQLVDHALGLRDNHPSMRVLRSGIGEFLPSLTDEALADASRDPDHLKLLHDLKFRSVMSVPLISQHTVLGVISIVSSDPLRRYNAADLELAEELGRRAAQVIEKTRLHLQTADANRSREEAVALLDTLVASAPVGMAFLDREGKYRRINQSLARIHGLDIPVHIGKTPIDIFGEHGVEFVKNIQYVLETGQPIVDMEVSGALPADPNGEQKTWLINFYPVNGPDSQILGVGATVVDITHRKNQEREVEQAKQNAERANQAKDQFLAVLSHELRTPLTPVLMAVQDLASTPVAPELVPVLAMIRRNVELEARLIDDLLDLTRISKGKIQLQLETVDSHELINSAINICKSEAQAKGVELIPDLQATIRHVSADSARLQQVIWNLLNNAIKFTPAGGRIAIKTFNEEERFVAQVIDSGIGIDATVLPRIFDAFEQGEGSITRRFGGLGLGLAISRALIRMHWGQIAATSDGKGNGSTFTIKLAARLVTTPTASTTLSPPVAPADAAPSEKPAITRKINLMMVEDHDDTRNALRALLTRRGFSVKVAIDVKSALELAAQPIDIDLLISDIALPDGTGLDIIRHMRHRNGKRLRAIALSGFGMEEDLKKSRDAGFDQHLTKPVNIDRLEALIRQLVS